jgi:CDP-diglyceride synthetase
MSELQQIPFWIYIIFMFFIIRIEFKKYNKNIPYKESKKEKNISKRILKGILAGIHYSHFIGTYDHKKYNTQVFTPKTLECYIGGSLAALVLFVYPILAFNLSNKFGYSWLIILVIPIISNIVSIILNKRTNEIYKNKDSIRKI